MVDTVNDPIDAPAQQALIAQQLQAQAEAKGGPKKGRPPAVGASNKPVPENANELDAEPYAQDPGVGASNQDVVTGRRTKGDEVLNDLWGQGKFHHIEDVKMDKVHKATWKNFFGLYMSGHCSGDVILPLESGGSIAICQLPDGQGGTYQFFGKRHGVFGMPPFDQNEAKATIKALAEAGNNVAYLSGKREHKEMMWFEAQMHNLQKLTQDPNASIVRVANFEPLPDAKLRKQFEQIMEQQPEEVRAAFANAMMGKERKRIGPKEAKPVSPTVNEAAPVQPVAAQPAQPAGPNGTSQFTGVPPAGVQPQQPHAPHNVEQMKAVPDPNAAKIEGKPIISVGGGPETTRGPDTEQVSPSQPITVMTPTRLVPGQAALKTGEKFDAPDTTAGPTIARPDTKTLLSAGTEAAPATVKEPESNAPTLARPGAKTLVSAGSEAPKSATPSEAAPTIKSSIMGTAPVQPAKAPGENLKSDVDSSLGRTMAALGIKPEDVGTAPKSEGPSTPKKPSGGGGPKV